jgi:oligopeptidase B
MKAPRAKKIAKSLVTHGDERIDNYYWLNERENPKVIAYLEAENRYLEAQMQPTKAFENALFDEMVARFSQTDMSVPYLLQGFWYYSRFEEGAEYPIYCRRKENPNLPIEAAAAEEIVLNVVEMAKGFEYFQVGGMAISPNNEWVAYGVDTVSRRIYTIHFKNLLTGEILEKTIQNTTGSLVWGGDNQTVFYTVKDESLRSYKIFRHQWSHTQAQDECVWHETDETFNTYIYKSRDKTHIIIGSGSTVSNEFRTLKADQPMGEFQLFAPRKRDLEYSIDHFNDKFFITTNLDALNFRVMTCPTDQTSVESWTEFVSHRAETLLEGIALFNDFYILYERTEGITQLQICGWEKSKKIKNHYLNFGEKAFTISTGVNPTPNTHKVRVTYTSLTTPNSVYEYDVLTKQKTLLKQDPILAGTNGESFDAARYKSERLYATAADGVKVPISLVYRKDKFRKNGGKPLLLYAYGSYGHSMDVYFSATRLSLLDRGFAFAIAHIRGGEEMGRKWYEDGKMLKKKNTFTDFIACAEYLIENKYTSSKNLFAMGGSAGGLLMGAIINMRPELWRGVIAAVPFVDVVTTMLDETIPLTTGEFDEWGNPKDKIYYDYIKTYSPYDNVTAANYPAMLVTTGLHDSQVQYWEPAKWVAKLRTLKTNPRTPLFLYCNMKTGHGGASGRWERFREIAMEYTFLLHLAKKI